MNYQEARDYIEDAWKYAGGDMGLSSTKYLLDLLGNPQDDLEFVHVAGTNGKGSVSSFIATILQCAGYKIGRYISPTLYSYRERIQINGVYITREDFTKYVEMVVPAIDEMVKDGQAHPTPFEIETVISFLHFKEKGCDAVVLECGMGGKDDATNVIKTTKLAVLTSISLDHVGVLGNTLEEIATTKAGIIKPGAVVVTGLQTPEVENTLWAICTEKGNPFVVAKPKEAQMMEISVEQQMFRYHGKEIKISLAGSHQVENAVLALEAIETLKQVGFPMTDEEIAEGFLKTRWDGRFTVLCNNPYFIVDGAHNPDAAYKLKESIQMYFPGKRLIFIMGMFADKDYNEVLETMTPMAAQIFTITPPDPVRALPAEQFADAIRPYNANVKPCDAFSDAVEESFKAANTDDVIISFGSLSFVGEMTRLVQERIKC